MPRSGNSALLIPIRLSKLIHRYVWGPCRTNTRCVMDRRAAVHVLWIRSTRSWISLSDSSSCCSRASFCCLKSRTSDIIVSNSVLFPEHACFPPLCVSRSCTPFPGPPACASCRGQQGILEEVERFTLSRVELYSAFKASHRRA